MLPAKLPAVPTVLSSAPEDLLAPWEPLPSWHRPKETGRAFAAFTHWRDLGATRTLAAVQRALDTFHPTISRWAKAHRWHERVAAWDREQDRLDRINKAKAKKAALEKHAKLSIAHMTVLARPALELGKRIAEQRATGLAGMVDEDLYRLALESAKVLKTLVGIERVALGEPETITQQAITGPDGGPLQIQAMTVVDVIRSLHAERPARDAGAVDVLGGNGHGE
jgi:hypothetical protein